MGLTMANKRKIIIVIGIIILFISLIVAFKKYFMPEYDYYKITDLEKPEQEFLETFYSSDNVSKGQLFDIRYDYFKSSDDYKITVVKKVNDTIRYLELEAIAIQPNGKEEWLLGGFKLIDEYQELRAEAGSPCPHIMIWGSNTLIDFAMNKSKKEHITNHLIITLKYINGEEKHEIYVDKDN